MVTSFQQLDPCVVCSSEMFYIAGGLVDSTMFNEKRNSKKVGLAFEAATKDVCFALGMTDHLWNLVGDDLNQLLKRSQRKPIAFTRWTNNDNWVSQILNQKPNLKKHSKSLTIKNEFLTVDWSRIDPNHRVSQSKMEQIRLFPPFLSPFFGLGFCRR